MAVVSQMPLGVSSPIGLGGHLSGMYENGHPPQGSRQMDLGRSSPGLWVAQLRNGFVTKGSMWVMCPIAQIIVEVREEGIPNLVGRLPHVEPQGRVKTLPVPRDGVETETPRLPIRPDRAWDLGLSNAEVGDHAMGAGNQKGSASTHAGKRPRFHGSFGTRPVASGKSLGGRKGVC